MDVNLSGTIHFDKVIYRYVPTTHSVPLKIGELHGETKLSGSLLKPYAYSLFILELPSQNLYLFLMLLYVIIMLIGFQEV